MSKTDLVRQEMMAALKARDKERKEALSLLLSALKAKYIDKRADLTPEEEDAVVLREIKQAQETLDTAPANREDIQSEARFRIEVYSAFAPRQMDEAEIRAAIDGVLQQLCIEAPGPKDKGRVMKALMPLVKGKADGGLVNRLVGERLG